MSGNEAAEKLYRQNLSELTPEQAREHHLSRIRDYAVAHGIAAENIALIFEAGLSATRYLRPDVIGAAPAKRKEAA